MEEEAGVLSRNEKNEEGRKLIIKEDIEKEKVQWMDEGYKRRLGGQKGTRMAGR